VTAAITSSPSHVHSLQLTSLQSRPLYNILQHDVSYTERLLDLFTTPNVKEHFVSCL